MGQTKPIPLVGRLAIQLKMLTSSEVERAIAESVSSGNPRLAQVFLRMKLLDREQIAKLQQVHESFVEKHRAKRESTARGGPAMKAGPARPASPVASASPPTSHDAEIHAAAEHAATVSAPMTSGDVEALHEAPPTERVSPRVAPPRSPVPSTPSTPSPPAPAPVPPAASAARNEDPAAFAQESPPTQPAFNGSSDEVSFSLELPVPNPTSADRERLEEILSSGVSNHASDIHLHAGGPLKQRINGEFVVTAETVEPDAIERLVSAALTPEQREILGRDGELDFCFELPGVGRFRANAYRQQRGLDSVFRVIPDKPPTLEELGLPDDLKKYTDYHQGMVLITGPAGCGKSATLAALVNYINEQRDEHILTVEDPIEILHPSKNCLVNQRHAGHHTSSFARALRGALREDPDIIVIGELRDLETISLAMTAAETGHFVLATLHTANAVRTVNRMIGAFPSNEQDQVRAMLSESLRAVLSQRLVPTADGKSRVPALELLVINRAIGNLIRDEKTVQIRSSMQTGKSHGMYLLEQSLNDLVASGTITREIALELAEEKKLITAGA
jgi:twitching motility protein PilT